MQQAVVLFALAWALLAGQDRAVPATSNSQTASAQSSIDTGPMPLCPPSQGCPLQ